MVWRIKWLGTFLSLFFAVNLSAVEAIKAPVFPKKKISIGKKILNVEVAETYEQHSYGLMNRDHLADGTGMIFVFPDSEIRSFWMKNTFIDLSIGYFDQNKTLFQIVDMKATSLMQKDFPSYPSSGPAQYALEVPKGWFEKNGIKIENKIKYKFEWR